LRSCSSLARSSGGFSRLLARLAALSIPGRKVILVFVEIALVVAAPITRITYPRRSSERARNFGNGTINLDRPRRDPTSPVRQ
jgi:hypothetical protein